MKDAGDFYEPSSSPNPHVEVPALSMEPDLEIVFKEVKEAIGVGP